MNITLPPLPPLHWKLNRKELRARDIEVAKCVLEAAAAHIVELPCECCWPDGAGSVAGDFAADILTLVFAHD